MNKPDTIRSTRIKRLIRKLLLSKPLYETKSYKHLALDLGCGWGNYFEINPEAYGIDLDDNCINYLHSKGYKAIKSDLLERFPFDDEQFNCVIAHDLLEHFTLSETRTILNEIYRVLRRKGQILILIPHKKGFEYGLKINTGHKHFIIPKEIIKLTENRFALKKLYSYPLPRFLGKYFTHNKEVLVLEKL